MPVSKAAVLDVVNQRFDTWVARLQELVTIDSESGAEHDSQCAIEGWLRQMGGTPTRVVPGPTSIPDIPGLALHPDGYEERFNVICSFGNPSGPTVVLNGHIDTVAAEGPWTRDPHRPYIQDGGLVGLGSVDMKGGLVGMLAAVEVVMSLHPEFPGELLVCAVVDEEAGGGVGSAATLQEAAGADLVIVGEPTNNAICTAGMGSLVASVTVHGKGAHGNLKQHGESAIDAALLAHDILRDVLTASLSEQAHQAWNRGEVNLGRIQGGIGATSVADSCTMEYCIAYPPSMDPDALAKQFLDLVDDIQAGDTWPARASMDARVVHNVEPFHQTDLDATARRFVGGALGERAIASDWSPSTFPAGSDARLYHRYAGLPVVVFGPGDFLQAHGPDETLELAQLRDYIGELALGLLQTAAPTTDR